VRGEVVLVTVITRAATKGPILEGTKNLTNIPSGAKEDFVLLNQGGKLIEDSLKKQTTLDVSTGRRERG